MRLLQIDSCLSTGSTGRITESIARIAQNNGWECYIIHGSRFVRSPSCMSDFQPGTIIDEYFHYIESLLLDNHGLSSRATTRKMIEYINYIKPDIIHLHCIHGYYLNYKILFEYLNTTNIPVVWTFHDCWAFTGHCAHFVSVGCERWKSQCSDCPRCGSYPRTLIDRSSRNYKLKQKLFTTNNNLYLVAVSGWLEELTMQSFFKEKDVCIIRNGVDINVFKPMEKTDSSKIKILGVSSVWTKAKGLDDFYHLRSLLEEDKFEITLVGLTKKQIRELPDGIIGIERTESLLELVSLYSSTDVFVNPTYADTFPTVNIEALACGTPVITYKTGGSPEAITPETGWVLEPGDVLGIASVIRFFLKSEKQLLVTQRNKCRLRAEMEFDKDKCFDKYLELYKNILSQEKNISVQ